MQEPVNAVGEALYKAASKGNNWEVKRLLKTAQSGDIEYQHKVDSISQTTFHFVFNSMFYVVGVLQGAIWNITPLMAAVENKHTSVIHTLLAAGADVNAQEAQVTNLSVSPSYAYITFAICLLFIVSDWPNGPDGRSVRGQRKCHEDSTRPPRHRHHTTKQGKHITNITMENKIVDGLLACLLNEQDGRLAMDWTINFGLKVLIRDHGKEVPKTGNLNRSPLSSMFLSIDAFCCVSSCREWWVLFISNGWRKARCGACAYC